MGPVKILDGAHADGRPLQVEVQVRPDWWLYDSVAEPPEGGVIYWCDILEQSLLLRNKCKV